jgi:ABC-type bacteriocin/lantibiotic exporter with double-glycine peptidase domain
MSKSKITLREVFKTIIWPRRKLIAIGLILIVISRVASLVIPWATKYIIDDVMGNKDLYMLKVILAAISASIVIQAVTSYMLTKILSVEAQHLISVLRVKVQKQILRLPYPVF